MIPKTGNRFHDGRGAGLAYPQEISGALQLELGNSHQAVKTLMRWTGAKERTAKTWLSGSHGPSGEHLLHLVKHSDSVFECLLRLSGRRLTVSDRKLSEVREVLRAATALLDEAGSYEDKKRSH